MIWFVRMAQWVRHPPSPRKVAIVLVTLALCLGLIGIEYLWGWPDWLTVNRRLRP